MSKARRFFQSFDRYAQVVSLTYKKSGKFETAMGGCVTIISFFVLIYWVIINLLYSIADDGSFQTSFVTQVTQESDGEFPIFETTGNDLFIAYRLNSFLPD